MASANLQNWKLSNVVANFEIFPKIFKILGEIISFRSKFKLLISNEFCWNLKKKIPKHYIVSLFWFSQNFPKFWIVRDPELFVNIVLFVLVFQKFSKILNSSGFRTIRGGRIGTFYFWKRGALFKGPRIQNPHSITSKWLDRSF